MQENWGGAVKIQGGKNLNKQRTEVRMTYYLDIDCLLVLVILTPPVLSLLFIATRDRAMKVSRLLGYCISWIILEQLQFPFPLSSVCDTS